MSGSARSPHLRRTFLPLLAALSLLAAPVAAQPAPEQPVEAPQSHHGNLAYVYIGILALIPALVLIGLALGVDTEEDMPASP